MEYLENTLSYADYVRLRESVGWLNFSKEQTENAINHSLYIATAAENGETVAMGRLIGDGQYHLIADVIVHPDFQHQKIGTSILNMLLHYVSENTPAGGRSSVQLIAEPGKEPFYESLGFKRIPHEYCGCGMRKIIRRE